MARSNTALEARPLRRDKMHSEKIYPAGRNATADGAQYVPSPAPLVRDADQDPQRMQGTGCNDEARGKRNRIGGFGQFCAMGVAVKDREDPDQHRRDPQRWPRGERDHATQNDRGQCDADFDSRDRHPEPAEDPTERHDQRKSNGQHPYRRLSQLRAPDANRDHRDNVIEPEHRVLDARDEAPGDIALSDMRESNTRLKPKRRDCCAPNATARSNP